MGNVFALLGLRALFVLVEGLMRRFRYLDETIAVVLGLVGVKLLIEDWVHIGPVSSLLIVLGRLRDRHGRVGGGRPARGAAAGSLRVGVGLELLDLVLDVLVGVGARVRRSASPGSAR